MCSLLRSKYSNLKLAEATMGRGPGSCKEVWWKRINVGCNTQVHGSNTRNLAVYLSLSQTSNNALSFLLSLMFSLQQNQRRVRNRFCLEGRDWGLVGGLGWWGKQKEKKNTEKKNKKE
jgi:hypothetical protein